MPSSMANTLEFADAVPVTGAPQTPKYPPNYGFVVAGSQPQRIEWVCFTFVNNLGESAPSPEIAVQVPANNILGIVPLENNGVVGPNASLKWNAYMSTAGSGQETKQNTKGPIDTGTPFVEAVGGQIAGSALPSAVAPAPGFTNGTIGLSHTPNTPGFSQPFTPSGTAVTNTGKTQMATQTALSRFSGIS